MALALVLTSAVIASCGGEGPVNVTQGTVIQNATIVNTRDGSLSTGQAVVVDGGKITRILPASSVRATGSAQLIDGAGKFLVPGYMDMHAHALFRADANPSYFPLMIANGVTSWRDMAIPPGTAGTQASWIARGRQLQADTAAGRTDAPELLQMPSLLFSGVTTAQAASDGVDQQKALGADFIKVISANRDAMLAFLAESKKQGLGVSGHLTPAVSAAESSQLGWQAIEHLGGTMGLLMDCSTDADALRQTILAGAGSGAPSFPTDAASVNRVLNTYSADKCKALAAEFVKNGTWLTPTIHRMRGIYTPDDTTLVNDPDNIYVDKARLAAWTTSTQQYANRPAADRAAQKQLLALHQSVTRLMKQAGVKMMMGTDAGLLSTWVVPGFSLHDEFRDLSAAGLAPLEILQLATLNSAQYLRRDATMGTVDEGKVADLVLLDGNPVQDAANLSKISGVVLRGKYFAKAALDKLKADTATLYKTQVAEKLPVLPEGTHAD